MPNYSTEYEPAAPIAAVAVTSPSTGQCIDGVPMLLDTGADITVLPQSVVDSLQPPGQSTIRMQAFDGNVLEHTTYDLTVSFLNGSFRGDFAAISAPAGIIGRDILNHFRIEFDGPNLVWQDSSANDRSLGAPSSPDIPRGQSPRVRKLG